MPHLEASKIVTVLLIAAGLYSPAIAQSGQEFEAIKNRVAELHDAGKYAEAIAFVEQTLERAETGNAANDPGRYRMLNLVGGLYAARGRLAEAERMFQRSLRIAQRELGPDHPDVADLLNNIGALHDIQGHYQQAEMLYWRALAMRVKVLSPDHPDLAISYENVARLYRRRLAPPSISRP